MSLDLYLITEGTLDTELLSRSRVLFDYLSYLLSHLPSATPSITMNSISTPTIASRVIPRMMSQTLRQWGYLISEAIPMTRQTLNLISLQGFTSCSTNRTATRQRQHDPTMFTAGPTTATVKVDVNTTCRLRAECATRGISLDSALLASLFLAAAEAVRTERQRKRQQHQGGNALSARLTRFLVLAMVCFVMALLSGSVESKLMRYLCSLYAVIAGTSSLQYFRS